MVTLIVTNMLVTITWPDKHPLITDYSSVTRPPHSGFNLNSLVWSGDFFFSLLAGNYSATLLLHLFIDPLLNCWLFDKTQSLIFVGCLIGWLVTCLVGCLFWWMVVRWFD